jgi:hypothetical protein
LRFRMHAGSRPHLDRTVDTKYPRAQKTTHKVPLPLSIHSRQMDRDPSLDKPDHLRNRVLRRDQHVHTVRQQMPFLNPALILKRQLPKHLAQVPSQIAISSDVSPLLAARQRRGFSPEDTKAAGNSLLPHCCLCRMLASI